MVVVSGFREQHGLTLVVGLVDHGKGGVIAHEMCLSSLGCRGGVDVGLKEVGYF